MNENNKITFKNKCFKEMVIVLLAVGIGLISTIFITEAKKQTTDNIQQGLARNLIRFHVIANSDSQEDQALKLKVRDKILESMKSVLAKSNSIEESRELIINNIDYIKKIAEKEIYKNNKPYKVSVALENAKFPTKSYGDIVLPTGNYESLRVKIGNAKGKNWWCVMFPPLCFVDATHGVVPETSKKKLKNILTEEEYDSILSKNKNVKVPVKVKFKFVEMVNKSNKRDKKQNSILAFLFGNKIQ